MLRRAGIKNSITDVVGVGVAHLTVDAGEVQTGATIILPYPPAVRDRKLFIGSFASGNWQAWTSRQVAEDFGTFSSPIVLCNVSTVGIAYDAMITYGHQRALDLPIDNAWPPLVIGIDDGYLNDLRQRRLAHDDFLTLVKSTNDGPMPCGSVGIGRGLCALGGKGGVGNASRVVTLSDEYKMIGVFIAANGGRLKHDAESVSVCSLTPSTVLIVATDAPLLQGDLCALAEASLRGLDEIIDWGPDDRQLALAFTTGNFIDEAFEEKFRLKPVRWQRLDLRNLFDVGAEAAQAALRRALAEAEPVSGRRGRRVGKVDTSRI